MAHVDRRPSLRPFTRVLAFIGMTGLMGLALLIVAEVLSRWLFNAPIRSENIIDVVTPIVVACSLPMGLLHGQDVAIQFLGKWLGRAAEDVLEILAMLTTLVFYVLLTWQVFVYAGELAAGNRVTEILKIPMAPWWYATATLLGLCAMVQAVVLAARIQAWGTGRFRHLEVETVTGDMAARDPAGPRR
jgi:TRAP-type C4-dicarboxylate transport system permease small subunit